MKRLPEAAAAAALIFICVVSVWAGRTFFFPKAELSKEAFDLARSEGSPQAPVWVVEYLDYECASCRRAYLATRDIFRKNESRLYLQARFFPLKKHRYALKAAIYASAAAKQGKFWPTHELLFEKQAEWSQAPPDKIDALFENYAVSSGLDLKALTTDVNDPRVKEKVFEEIQAAKSLGVNIMPTFFFNGRMAAGFDAVSEEAGKITS